MTGHDTAPTPRYQQRRSPGAERMRHLRLRRRDGICHVVPFEIMDREIALLIAGGFLRESSRTDRSAIARALGSMLAGLPETAWTAQRA